MRLEPSTFGTARSRAIIVIVIDGDVFSRFWLLSGDKGRIVTNILPLHIISTSLQKGDKGGWTKDVPT